MPATRVLELMAGRWATELRI